MVDPVSVRRMVYWAIFLLIWAFSMFVWILPSNIIDGNWPAANWTLLFAFAWVLRRPNFVPVALVACLFLLDDLIFMRPPGLMASLSIIGLEFLRNRSKYSRELPFLFEWALVATVISAIMAMNLLMQALFVITLPEIRLYFFYYVITLLAYPLTVLVSAQLLGVRQLKAGAIDERGATS